jgi:hypothetical protein
MDDASRKKLTYKFAKLTVVLDGVFLFAAIAILAAAGVIPVYSIPIAVIFGLASIVLAVYFVGAYRRDKAWLASVPDDKPAKTADGEQKKADDVTEAATAAKAGTDDATEPDT